MGNELVGRTVDVRILCVHAFGVGVELTVNGAYGHVNPPRVSDDRFTVEETAKHLGEIWKAVVLAADPGRQPTLTLRPSEIATSWGRNPIRRDGRKRVSVLNPVDISEFLARVGERLLESRSTLEVDEPLKDFCDLIRSSGSEGLLEIELLKRVRNVQNLHIPVEVVQYLAHVFGWSSLRSSLAGLLAGSQDGRDLREVRVLELINDSLDSDWEDRDFFHRCGRKRELSPFTLSQFCGVLPDFCPSRSCSAPENSIASHPTETAGLLRSRLRCV
ncbi:hypothetical protein [Micromonospora sp. SH-82]|uniref:hypothetical protein n=1 Tax=Micromonospora sp. SH-82 TaxID=3132938 RepID=UPI003EC0F4BF